MNEEQYMQMKQQAQTGNEAFYRPPLDNIEGATNVDHPIPYLEMGSSFLIGLAVGFFIKKSFKIVLFILGLGLIVMFIMESKGAFTIDDKIVEQGVAQGTDLFKEFVNFIKNRITSFKTGVGALAGFVVGLKLG